MIEQPPTAPTMPAMNMLTCTKPACAPSDGLGHHSYKKVGYTIGEVSGSALLAAPCPTARPRRPDFVYRPAV